MIHDRLTPWIVIWAISALIGMTSLWTYEAAPGAVADAPAMWPQSSTLTLHTDRLTLLLFAHPRCPCTEATVRELERLLAQCDGRFAAQVVFYHPPDTPDDWSMETLWHQATAIPGVEVRLDEAGAESDRFGVITSGQVLIYEPSGRQLFAGGITPGRGHSGDSTGRSAILDLAFQPDAPNISPFTPVFGCQIRELPTTSAATSSDG